MNYNTQKCKHSYSFGFPATSPTPFSVVSYILAQITSVFSCHYACIIFNMLFSCYQYVMLICSGDLSWQFTSTCTTPVPLPFFTRSFLQSLINDSIHDLLKSSCRKHACRQSYDRDMTLDLLCTLSQLLITSFFHSNIQYSCHLTRNAHRKQCWVMSNVRSICHSHGPGVSPRQVIPDILTLYYLLVFYTRFPLEMEMIELVQQKLLDHDCSCDCTLPLANHQRFQRCMMG
jgi:hypothetical protein